MHKVIYLKNILTLLFVLFVISKFVFSKKFSRNMFTKMKYYYNSYIFFYYGRNERDLKYLSIKIEDLMSSGSSYSTFRNLILMSAKIFGIPIAK